MTAFDGDWKSPCGCEAHLRGLEEVGFGLGGGRAEEAGVRRDGDWKSPCGCEAYLCGLRGWVLGWVEGGHRKRG